MTLWEQVYDYQSLYEAYLRARKEKRYRGEVLEFSYSLEENLISLQNELIWGEYRPGEYRHFLVTDPKERPVVAAPFRDRVVQHSLNAVMEPIFDRVMYRDSYACRKGGGTHEAARRVAYFLGKQGNAYYLKGDIQKYFPSIDHDILRDLFRRRLHDEDVLHLIDLFLESVPGDGAVGMPIGNLLSQLSANVYLHELDHYVKSDLGVKYYVRYMDDFLIFHSSKRRLYEILQEVRAWLSEHLHLRLNRKTRIDHAKNGVDFVGYRIWSHNKLIRKKSLQRMRRKMRAWKNGKTSDENYLASLGSWIGHCRETATRDVVETLLFESLQHATGRSA